MLGLAECADPGWLLNPKNPDSDLARVLPYGGGGFNRSAHSARPGIICGATCSEEPSQISNTNHQVYQNCPKNDQGGSKKVPKSIKTGSLFTQGGPKINKNVFRDPFGTQSATKTQTGPYNRDLVTPCLELRAALGAPRADLGHQGVSQNHPKST